MTAIASDLAPSALHRDDSDTDTDILRRYLRDGDRDAFTRLVQRHLAMVYATARRALHPHHLGDAEDVTQAVFILLARKAATIRPNTSLAAWLYNATRMTAANARRSAVRRRRHEHEAGESMRQHRSASSPSRSPSSASEASLTWSEVEPALDDAMSCLRPHDREAIVLRFLASRSLREVGDAVGISEDAARVRVNRALARLRQLLGVSVPMVALTAALQAGAAHAAATAPAHLAAAVAASALTPAVGSTAAALAGTTAVTITPPGLKLAAAAVAAILIAGAGTAGVVLLQAPAPLPQTANAAPLASPSSSNIPTNSPRGITLSILRAGAAGDRRTMRTLMQIENDIEQKSADCGVEYLIAEGRFDATVAAKFPRARGLTRIGYKIQQIATATESIKGDRAGITGWGGMTLNAYVVAGGQWKMIPSSAMLEGVPREQLDRKLDEANAITRAMDTTAAEVDSDQYPTRTVAMDALNDRIDAILTSPPAPQRAARTTTTAATQVRSSPTTSPTTAAPAAR